MKSTICLYIIATVGLANTRWACTSPTTAVPTDPEKSPTIDPLFLDQYNLALAEEKASVKRPLIVYAGGDTYDQQSFTKNEFEKAFPGIHAQIIVDLSKDHNQRIDKQIANNALIPDIAQLQTLGDFPRWKKDGRFLNYKPIGFESIFEQFRDPDGAWISVFGVLFGIVVNTEKLTPEQVKKLETATELLNPDLKGKMVAVFPNDDDATLLYYDLLLKKYGWDFIEKLAKQDIKFVRGTAASSELASNGTYSLSIGTASSVNQADKTHTLVNDDVDVIMSWAQRAAIFKTAKRPETAKLYLSWIINVNYQNSFTQYFGFPIRSDATTILPGAKKILDMKNTDTSDFPTFWDNAKYLKEFKDNITMLFGEVTGGSPTYTDKLGATPSIELTKDSIAA